MSLASITDWRQHSVKLGLVASVCVLLFGAWASSDVYIVTEAEAAIPHLEQVRLDIESLELEKIRVKHRADLEDAVKDEYIARIEMKLHLLRKMESCLERGRLDCD